MSSMQKKIESVKRKSEMRFELKPKFDSRKSFYGKATVDDEGGAKTLYSYNTPVARVTDGKLELLPKWNYSQTTRRHVADFVRQMDVEDQYLKLKKGESHKNERSYGYGYIKVSDEDVVLTVNNVEIDEHGGSFSVETPEDGNSYSLQEMKDMITGMCEDCAGYSNISCDGSDICIAVMASDYDENGEFTGDYYNAYVIRCNARIVHASLEGIVDYLDAE